MKKIVKKYSIKFFFLLIMILLFDFLFVIMYYSEWNSAYRIFAGILLLPFGKQIFKQLLSFYKND